MLLCPMSMRSSLVVIAGVKEEFNPEIQFPMALFVQNLITCRRGLESIPHQEPGACSAP